MFINEVTFLLIVCSKKVHSDESYSINHSVKSIKLILYKCHLNNLIFAVRI